MIKIPDYKHATNAAYEILKKYNGSLPNVEIQKIINMLSSVNIYKYSEIAKRFGIGVYDFKYTIAPSEFGYTIFDTNEDRWLLIYNESKCKETIRFTLAHELGHIVLKHTDDNEINNSEANCFARNILCPLPIRDYYDLKTPIEYSKCFFISEPMATATINHYDSDLYYISQYNYTIIQNKISETAICQNKTINLAPTAF